MRAGDIGCFRRRVTAIRLPTPVWTALRLVRRIYSAGWRAVHSTNCRRPYCSPIQLEAADDGRALGNRVEARSESWIAKTKAKMRAGLSEPTISVAG